MRKREDRVLGPYRIGPSKWRYVTVRNGVKTSGPLFDTREEAEQSKIKIAAAIASQAAITFRDALDLYTEDMRARGLRAGSIDSAKRRIAWFLDEVMDRPVSTLTTDKARRMLKALSLRPSRYGRPYSAAWIKVTIVGLRTFGKFLIEDEYAKASVFEGLKHKGRMNKGKTKLTLDEARTYARTAHALADAGDEGAVQALCALYTGMRKGEIQDLTARALDDRGQRLIIFRSKTEAGQRTIMIPTVLRPYLARAAQGKAPGEFLFENRSRTLINAAVHRICRNAGLPMVCPHSFRGLLADLAVASGEVLNRVSAMLGHAGPQITLQHYADRGAIEDQARAKGQDLIADPDRSTTVSDPAGNDPDSDGE